MLPCLCVNRIKTHIANGYHKTIWCRVTGDKNIVVEKRTEGGIGVPGGEIKAGYIEKIHHTPGGRRGFTKVGHGLSLKFSVNSDHAYVTIHTQDDYCVCYNYELTGSCNLIVNAKSFLQTTKRGKKWTDAKGRRHSIDPDKFYVVNEDQDKSSIPTRQLARNFDPRRTFSSDGQTMIQGYQTALSSEDTDEVKGEKNSLTESELGEDL